MSSKSKHTKDTYQGINVRNMPRSELADHTMRDLSRHGNRLDNSLKTVDRAQKVVLKALEHERHIFMKGNGPATRRHNPAIKNPGDSRQRRDSHPNKYQPDTRKSKTQINGTSTQQPQQHHHNKNIIRNEIDLDRDRDILNETRDVISKQNRGDDLVEQIISRQTSETPSYTTSASSSSHNNNNSPTTNPSNTTTTTTSTRVHRKNSNSSSRKSGDIKYPSPVQLQDGASTNNSVPAQTPSIKIDEYQAYDAVDGGGKTGAPPHVFYDDLSSYGRRPQVWNYLSQPKNQNRSLQKREQLEREFTNTNLNSRVTTPSARSARGERSSKGTLSGSSNNKDNSNNIVSPSSGSTGNGVSSSSRVKSARGTKKSASSTTTTTSGSYGESSSSVSSKAKPQTTKRSETTEKGKSVGVGAVGKGK